LTISNLFEKVFFCIWDHNKVSWIFWNSLLWINKHWFSFFFYSSKIYYYYCEKKKHLNYINIGMCEGNENLYIVRFINYVFLIWFSSVTTFYLFSWVFPQFVIESIKYLLQFLFQIKYICSNYTTLEWASLKCSLFVGLEKILLSGQKQSDLKT
jgi:hypothetical protein